LKFYLNYIRYNSIMSFFNFLFFYERIQAKYLIILIININLKKYYIFFKFDRFISTLFLLQSSFETPIGFFPQHFLNFSSFWLLFLIRPLILQVIVDISSSSILEEWFTINIVFVIIPKSTL
jgi:hypothetical protein